MPLRYTTLRGSAAGNDRAQGRRHPDLRFGGGKFADPLQRHLCATKAFVNTFSESLRGEVRGSGVHVTLLAPGPVRTDLPDDAERSLVEKLVPDFLWISTEHTAQISLDALSRNKMRVVPGLTSKPCRSPAVTLPRDRGTDRRQLL